MSSFLASPLKMTFPAWSPFSSKKPVMFLPSQVKCYSGKQREEARIKSEFATVHTKFHRILSTEGADQANRVLEDTVNTKGIPFTQEVKQLVHKGSGAFQTGMFGLYSKIHDPERKKAFNVGKKVRVQGSRNRKRQRSRNRNTAKNGAKEVNINITMRASMEKAASMEKPVSVEKPKAEDTKVKSEVNINITMRVSMEKAEAEEKVVSVEKAVSTEKAEAEAEEKVVSVEKAEEEAEEKVVSVEKAEEEAEEMPVSVEKAGGGGDAGERGEGGGRADAVKLLVGV